MPQASRYSASYSAQKGTDPYEPDYVPAQRARGVSCATSVFVERPTRDEAKIRLLWLGLHDVQAVEETQRGRSVHECGIGTLRSLGEGGEASTGFVETR